MSIRFGWTRPQAAPPMTDEKPVEDLSSPPADFSSEPEPPAASGTSAPLDALRDVATRVHDGEVQGSDAVREVFELHSRVLESERKSQRFLAGASAKREFHEALVAEADALNKLGFENFDAFAAVHGTTPPPAGAPVPASMPANETISRISVLLGELGVEPGEDPLETAKTFLSRVEAPEG